MNITDHLEDTILLLQSLIYIHFFLVTSKKVNRKQIEP